MCRVFSLCLPFLKVRIAKSGLIECIRQVDNVAREALNVRLDTGSGQPGRRHATYNLSDTGLAHVHELTKSQLGHFVYVGVQ